MKRSRHRRRRGHAGAQATARGEAEALEPTEEEGRLLTRLRTTGPLWAWLPTTTERPTELTDPVVAKHARAVGGSLHIGDTPRLSFITHASGRESADALEAQLGALGRVVSAMSANAQNDALLNIVSALTRARATRGGQQKALEAIGGVSAPSRPARPDQRVGLLSP